MAQFGRSLGLSEAKPSHVNRALTTFFHRLRKNVEKQGVGEIALF